MTGPRRSGTGFLLAALLAACADPGPAPAPAPALRAPGAVLALERRKAQAEAGDWAALAATDPGACSGPRDAICAEAQALRARACRQQAEAAGHAAARRPLLECAIAAGQAALAAAEASPPAQRRAWREALAWSLFLRRQGQSRAALCPDNQALRAQAAALLAEAASPAARFLAASARLTDASEGCAPAARHCADLAEARALLAPAPAAEPRWAALAAATIQESRRLGCP